MIRKVTVRKNIITIDWDQSDEDFFMRVGLQALCDEHFGGKRNVVVVPYDAPCNLPGGRSRWFATLDKAKKVEISDEFAHACVEAGVNLALREAIDRLEAQKTTKKAKVAKASPKRPKKSDPSPEVP